MITLPVHYSCGHMLKQTFASDEEAVAPRTNARFQLCYDCLLEQQFPGLHWEEEETVFERRRVATRHGHQLVQVDTRWGPPGVDNPCRQLKSVEVLFNGTEAYRYGYPCRPLSAQQRQLLSL